MELIQHRFGKFEISQVIEIDAGDVIQETIPDATPEAIVGISWLRPHYADADGKLKGVVQSFLVRAEKLALLVDTCVGNDKHRVDLAAWGNLQTEFLTKLRQAGCDPSDITDVLCTHLHFDHVGWNTVLKNGVWQPTFPNARYMFSAEEWRYWNSDPQNEIADDKQGISDSVRPIFEAGLAHLLEDDAQVCEGVRLIPTPGHTPHHVSVLIESEGTQCLITGDAIHHPCQIHHPEWGTASDFDRNRARQTRESMLETYSGKNTVILGNHFAVPSGGRVRVVDGRYRFFPE